MKRLKWILVAIVSLLALVFLAQNTETVTFHFLAWQFSLPRIVVLLGAALVGFFIGLQIDVRSEQPKSRRRASSADPDLDPTNEEPES